MWNKCVVRTLAAAYIVGGVATLLAPESMGRFARWFADHPLYMRLDGIAVTTRLPSSPKLSPQTGPTFITNLIPPSSSLEASP